MKIERITTDPDPYERFRLALGYRVGELLFVSGQASMDENAQLVGAGDFDAQAEQTFRNLQRVLEAGGSSLANVVKVTIFLTDMSNFEKIVELRGKWFTPPYPADTIVEVSVARLSGADDRDRGNRRRGRSRRALAFRLAQESLDRLHVEVWLLEMGAVRRFLEHDQSCARDAFSDRFRASRCDLVVAAAGDQGWMADAIEIACPVPGAQAPDDVELGGAVHGQVNLVPVELLCRTGHGLRPRVEAAEVPLVELPDRIAVGRIVVGPSSAELDERGSCRLR